MIRRLLAIPVLLALVAPARADLVIDDFTTGAQVIAVSTGTATSTATGLPAAHTIGTERTVTDTIIGNPLNLTSTAAVIPIVGVFTLSNDALVSSTGSLLYSGPGGAGLGGLNLSAAGSQFSLNILAIDLSLTLGIVVTDGAGHTSTESLSGLSTGTVNLGFNAFTGTADFSNVKSIEVTFNAPNSADFAASFFGVTGTSTAVPEPSVVALSGVAGVAGLGLSWRRRRRAAAAV
jgi:hypothetical protein